MSEAKFTKGPWDASGDVIIGDDRQVALVISSETSDYDAALIAAAPELYHALKDTVERLRFAAEKLDNADFVIDAMAKPFEDLLAKARGE